MPCCDSQYKSSSVSVTSRLTLTTTGHWRCAPTCCWSEERWRKPSTASGAPSLSSPTLAFQNISKAGTSCDSLQRVNLVFTGRGYLSSDVYSSLGGVSRENSGIRICVREVSFSVRGLFVVTSGHLELFLTILARQLNCDIRL